MSSCPYKLHPQPLIRLFCHFLFEPAGSAFLQNAASPVVSLLPLGFAVAGSAFLLCLCSAQAPQTAVFQTPWLFLFWHRVLPQFRCFSCFCLFFSLQKVLLYGPSSALHFYIPLFLGSGAQNLKKLKKGSYYSKIRSRWIIINQSCPRKSPRAWHCCWQESWKR